MPFQLDHLDVTEIVRPIESGMTQPFLCQLADDQLYAVKGRGALAAGLIGEVVAGWLGKQLGLPIPDFVIAEMPPGLVAAYADQMLISAVGAGPAFGSLWQEPVETMGTPLLATFPNEVLAKIYAFDHWIMNSDRTLTEHGGNPNMLVKLDTGGLVVIDHNLAFSGSYHPDELMVHACRNAWTSMSRHYLFREELSGAMGGALLAIDDVVGVLPTEWVEAAPDFLPYVLEVVSRVSQPGFWGELQ